MALSIFPGCLAAYRFPEYEKSASLVLEALGMAPVFVDLFTCCGSQVAESADDMFLLATGIRNLAIAQARSVNTLVCLCGSCAYELLRARERAANPFTEARINLMLAKEGLRYDAADPPIVKHILEILGTGRPRGLLERLCSRKMNFPVAVQEPCNAFSPARLHPDLEGKASLLRGLVGLTGVECVDFEYEKRCCGGTMLAFDESVGKSLTALRHRALEKCGARLIATACPNCHSVYSVYSRPGRIPPALFVTQMIGLSMGMTPTDVGLRRHMDQRALSELFG